jgi:hypothetical protein
MPLQFCLYHDSFKTNPLFFDRLLDNGFVSSLSRSNQDRKRRGLFCSLFVSVKTKTPAIKSIHESEAVVVVVVIRVVVVTISHPYVVGIVVPATPAQHAVFRCAAPFFLHFAVSF